MHVIARFPYLANPNNVADGAPFGFPFTSLTTPTLHGNPGGTLSQGFGYVNWVNGGLTQFGGAQQRSGQIVARFTF
jgi:hypothetical protein